MASISARRAAATAVEVVPVPMNEASSGLEPVAHHHVGRHEMRAGARRGHADLQPLQVLRRFVEIGLAGHHRQHEARIAAVLQQRHHRLVLGLHLDGVIEGADADLGAAADDRLQGAAAARDIGNLDVEAGVLEVAEPLGHRQRQIEHRRLAADRDPHLFLRACAGREQRGQRDRRQNSLCVLHDDLPTSLLRNWTAKMAASRLPPTGPAPARPSRCGSRPRPVAEVPAQPRRWPRAHAPRRGRSAAFPATARRDRHGFRP